MQAIILLLNAIFAKLTTAVNKAFTKSQRPYFTWADGGESDPAVNTWVKFFSDKTWDNNGVIGFTDITCFTAGDGQYRIRVSSFDGTIQGVKVSDGCFLNVKVVNNVPISVNVENFSDSQLAEISLKAAEARDEAIAFADEVATNAALDATAKANAAKSEAISTAASDATTKANNAKNQAITEAGLLATAAKNQAIEAAAQDATQKADGAEQAAITAASADATTKADAAKTQAIAAATLAAQQLANVAKSQAVTEAVTEAANDATEKASNAEANAIAAANLAAQEAQTAAQNNAATYTDTAKGEAIETANLYTDTEIAKLQLYAQKGIKNLGRFVHQLAAGPTAILGNLGTLPSAVAFGFTEVGYYVVEVEATDANGNAIFDKEGLLEVATGVDANGDAILSTITVSTEDELMLEVVLIDGVPFLKYVKKHDVRILEMFNDLSTKIETHVSEAELLSAVTDVKTYVDAQINAALV